MTPGESLDASPDGSSSLGEIELGGFKLELAGACWQVPEFANSSSNLLSTFKDLFVYETIQTMIPRSFGVEEQVIFYNKQLKRQNNKQQQRTTTTKPPLP